VQVIVDDHGGLPGEGRPPGQQLVQRDARGVHVAGGRGLSAGQRLRRHVAHRAHDHASRGDQGFPADPGDAEVGEPGAPPVHQHVARLQVAVDDPRRMRGGEPVAHLRDQLCRQPRRQRAAVVPPELVQVPLGEQIHHQGEPLSLDDHVVQRHHVRMLQRQQRVALAHEPGDRGRVPRILGLEHLDRAPVPRLNVFRAPYRAHAALANLLVQQVMTTDSLEGHKLGL